MKYRYAWLLLPILFATLLGSGLPPETAFACSPVLRTQTLQERIVELYRSEHVEAVTLAEVTQVRALSERERTLPHPLGGDSVEVLPPATVATFKAHVLWSDNGFSGNTVGPLHPLSPDCSGGAPLAQGDRVLLFLHKPRFGVAAAYGLSVFEPAIVFRGDQTFYISEGHELYPAGSAQEVIDYLLAVAASPETTSGPARQFAGLPLAP